MKRERGFKKKLPAPTKTSANRRVTVDIVFATYD
jgi:hypothetical protein